MRLGWIHLKRPRLTFFLFLLGVFSLFIAVAAAYPTFDQDPNSEYGLIAAWGGYGAVDGKFRGAMGIDADNNGYVYVVDSKNSRVQKFSTDGAFLGILGNGYGSGRGQLRNPTEIAIDHLGNKFVLDESNFKVVKFGPDDGYVREFGERGYAAHQFYDPQNIAVDNAGNVYVLTTQNPYIKKFDNGGNFVAAIGGVGCNTANGNRGIAIDADGVIYVSQGYQILKLYANGDFWECIGEYGTAPGHFESIPNIAIDAQGNIYAANPGIHGVDKIASDGEFIARFGVLGSGSYDFQGPHGVAVDSNGEIYVTDSAQNHVRRYLELSPKISEIGPYSVAEGSLLQINVTATDPDNDVLTFSFEGLPDGAAINSSTGVFTWTPTSTDAGVYPVKFRVSDDYWWDEASTVITVIDIEISAPNGPPVADAGGPYYVGEGATADLDASGSTDPDGDTLLYRWDLNGDGVWDTAQSESPTASGSWSDDYVGYVVVEVSDGTVSVIGSSPVVVSNTDPNIENQEKTISGFEGAVVSLWTNYSDAGSSDTHEAVVDWGDGSPASPAAISGSNGFGSITASHVYQDDRLYDATLTLVDGDGGSAVERFTADIENVAPAVDAGPVRRAVWGEAIAFSGTFQDPGGEDTHEFSWEFGDGNVATSQDAPHSYAAPGTYTATFSVKDDDGGIGVDTADVVINKLPSTLIYSGVFEGQYSDKARLAVRVMAGDRAVRFQQVEFFVGDQSVTAVTDFSGLAVADMILDQAAGFYPLRVKYNGDAFYGRSESHGSFKVSHEDIQLTYFGDELSQSGYGADLFVQLSETDSFVGDLSGRAVSFVFSNEIGRVTTIQAITDASGRAGANMGVDLPAGIYSVSVGFAGDNNYKPADSGSAPFTIWEPAPRQSINGAGTSKAGKVWVHAGYRNNLQLKGAVRVTDPATGLELRADSLEWLFVYETGAILTGIATVNGEASTPFTLYVTDSGNPGRKGQAVALYIDGELAMSGPLDSGNLHIKRH